MGFEPLCESCLGLGYACSAHNSNREFIARQQALNEENDRSRLARLSIELPDAISVERRVVIAGAAQEAFWRVVAEMLPEAKTGYIDVGAVMEFSRACDRAVEIWARTNVRLPEGEYRATWNPHRIKEATPEFFVLGTDGLGLCIHCKRSREDHDHSFASPHCKVDR